MKTRSEYIEAILQNAQAIKRAYAHGNRFSHRRFGMTMTQASVVMLLLHEGRKTMSEVADALGVSKGAATQLLDGLIERGIVERTQDETDKRVAYVSVSRKGLQHFRRMRRGGARHLTELFDLLDDTELEQIEAITKKLAERAKELRT